MLFSVFISGASAALTGPSDEITRELREMGSEPSSERFADIAWLLSLDDEEVVAAASAALRAIPNWKRVVVEKARSRLASERALAAQAAILDTKDGELAAAFARLVADRSFEVRRRALALASAWKESPGHLHTIKAAVQRSLPREKSFAMRYVSATFLSRFAESEDVASLLFLTRDRMPEVRVAALHGLGNLAAGRDAAAREALARLMQVASAAEERDGCVAIYYVGRDATPEARALLRRIQAGDGSPALKAAAAEALGGGPQ